MRKNITFKIIFYIIFPFLLVLITEFNQMQSINTLVNFIFDNYSVFLFSTIILAMLFLTLLFFVRQAYIAVAIESLLFYILSTVEYFKYKTSGTHLTLSDLAMTQNLSDVGKFAALEVTWPLIINFILILILIFVSYKLNIYLAISAYKRITVSIVFFITLLSSILLPNASEEIYAAFNIDNKNSSNIFEINDSFDNNGFIGFLSQTTTKEFINKLDKPDNYSEDYINSALSNTTTDNADFSKPDIIFIMSESFGDFRNLSDKIDNKIYSIYDKLSAEGILANCILPTFGGYTPRTEFELLFGLPVNSLNNPPIPHNLLKSRDKQLAIPQYFKSLGYETTYIHPFSGSFYNRNDIYPTFGFDNLYFEENMNTNVERYRRYISDKSVFEEIKYTLSNSTEPNYIFTTTMQNHQPYTDSDSLSTDELSYYLEGINKTLKDLDELLLWLKSYEREVMVVFVGDHYPFFTPLTNTYEELGINDTNISNLYKSTFILWNNYNLDLSTVKNQTISTFYIPYILLDVIGAPKNQFISTMLNYMDSNPIYSPNIQKFDTRDYILDNLTYDRIQGDLYSDK